MNREKEHAIRRQKRRSVKPGYPKTDKFTTPEQVANYFSEDRIVCLLCGKTYKSLGIHLKTIHDTEVDEYKEMYGLPWRRGLVGHSTWLRKSELGSQYMEDGTFTKPTREQSLKAQASKQRDRQPYRDVLTQRNLEKMNEGKSGEDAKRRAAATKIGTPEHRKKMQDRPQCKNPPDEFKYWWSGKEQTNDHVRKRTGSDKKT